MQKIVYLIFIIPIKKVNYVITMLIKNSYNNCIIISEGYLNESTIPATESWSTFFRHF
jgi:hypothetical protein